MGRRLLKLRVQNLTLIVVLIVAGVLVFGASTATATTISGSAVIATNLTASGSLTYGGGTFSGSLTFTNSSGTDQGLVAASLQLFGGGTTITSLVESGPPLWTDFYFGGNQSNNGEACKLTGGSGWICADGFTGGTLPFTMGVIPANGSLTFSFSGSYSGSSFISQLDLQADGCSTTADTFDAKHGTINCTANKWAYSAGLPGTPGTVPEPGTLALLGSGLLGAGGIIRRRIGL